MAYRQLPQPIPKPAHREMSVTSTHAEFKLTNGTISYLAIPCYYVEVMPPVEANFCQDWNKHIHHPDPRHPDHTLLSPEIPFIDPGRLSPIHLTEEGFTDARLVLYDARPHGFHARCWIDEYQDWIIRMQVHIDMVSAYSTSKYIPWSLFVDGDFDGAPVTQIVQRGNFLILPAVYERGYYANEDSDDGAASDQAESEWTEDTEDTWDPESSYDEETYSEGWPE